MDDKSTVSHVSENCTVSQISVSSIERLLVDYWWIRFAVLCAVGICLGGWLAKRLTSRLIELWVHSQLKSWRTEESSEPKGRTMSNVPTPEKVRDEMIAKLERYKEAFLLFGCYGEAADMRQMAVALGAVKFKAIDDSTIAWCDPPPAKEVSAEQYRQTLKESIKASAIAAVPARPDRVDCPVGTKIMLGGDVYEKRSLAGVRESWHRSSPHDVILSWCHFSDRAVQELWRRGAEFIFPGTEKTESKEQAQ